MRERLTKWLDWNTIGTVVVMKLLILGIGHQALALFNQQKVPSLYNLLEIWNRWDANHYLNIAANGYTAEGQDRFLIVFYPGYPALVALFQVVLRDYLLSAFVVSFFATIAAGLLLRQLAKLDNNERVARYAVLFLFIFPTSYFLHIPYTESLFLTFCMGSFLAARKRTWWLAGLLGMLACFTRVNGVILVPALMFEMWDEYRENRKINPAWLWAGLTPVGFLSYLGINYYVTGNAFMFSEHMRNHWYKYFRLPTHGISETYGVIFNDRPADAAMRGVQEMLFIVIGLGATILGWFRLRNSYRVWMLANWFLFVSTSFVLSVPRYTITLFPIFILMAQVAVKNWPAKVLFIGWSLLFLGIFASQFVRGWWAF